MAKKFLYVVIFVIACVGLFRFGAKQYKQNLSDSAAEAEKLYQTALAAQTSGDLAAEKASFEMLLNHHAPQFAETTMGEDAEPVSYGEIATKRLPQIECSLKYEMPSKDLVRTAEDTVKQLISAIHNQDRNELLDLVSCTVAEGVPESELDTVARDLAVDHLLSLQQVAKSEPFVYAGLESNLHVIASGKVRISLLVRPALFAPNANRIEQILWSRTE